MGDEWPVAALFWLEHTRDSAALWYDAGLDLAKAEPAASALLVTNLILLVLWISTLSRVRAAQGESKTQQATIAELIESYEKERKWRVASANVDARAQRPVTVEEEQAPKASVAANGDESIAARETSPQTIAAA